MAFFSASTASAQMPAVDDEEANADGEPAVDDNGVMADGDSHHWSG
jgi:hypothetical protein